MKNNSKIVIMIFILLQISLFLFADEVEFLNKHLLAFGYENMGKQIGRGECWDLAAEPLYKLGASWDGMFGFGKKIGTGSNSGLKMEPGVTLMPGDIIQFTNVQTAWVKNYPDGRITRGWETIGMPHHTAIISKFDGNTLLTLLHQNVSGKRHIVETTVDLANVKSGTYIIYRPFRIKKSSDAGKSPVGEMKNK
jgi:hypothetical protein